MNDNEYHVPTTRELASDLWIALRPLTCGIAAASIAFFAMPGLIAAAIMTFFSQSDDFTGIIFASLGASAALIMLGPALAVFLFAIFRGHKVNGTVLVAFVTVGFVAVVVQAAVMFVSHPR